MYAIIDDQNNRVLVKSELLGTLQFRGGVVNYVLTSYAASLPTKGRRATGLIVQSLDGSTRFKLPIIIECNNIHDVRSEIPTPDVARSYHHLLDVARFIYLIYTNYQYIASYWEISFRGTSYLGPTPGPRNTSYAQRLYCFERRAITRPANRKLQTSTR